MTTGCILCLFMYMKTLQANKPTLHTHTITHHVQVQGLLQSSLHVINVHDTCMMMVSEVGFAPSAILLSIACKRMINLIYFKHGKETNFQCMWNKLKTMFHNPSNEINFSEKLKLPQSVPTILYFETIILWLKGRIKLPPPQRIWLFIYIYYRRTLFEILFSVYCMLRKTERGK